MVGLHYLHFGRVLSDIKDIDDVTNFLYETGRWIRRCGFLIRITDETTKLLDKSVQK